MLAHLKRYYALWLFLAGSLIEFFFNLPPLVLDFFLKWTTQLSVYVLLPFLFFVISEQIVWWNEQKRLWLLTRRNIILILAFLFGLVFSLSILVYLYSPNRIGLPQESFPYIPLPKLTDYILKLFPASLGTLFFDDTKTLPEALLILAVLWGTMLFLLKAHTGMIRDLGQSLSEILGSLLQLMTWPIRGLFFFLGASLVSRIEQLNPLYHPLIFFVGIVSGFLAFIVVPFWLFSHTKKKFSEAFWVIFLETLLLCLATGNLWAGLGLFFGQLRQNPQISQRLAHLQIPAYALFFKGGALSLSILCTLVLLRAYSSLPVSIFDISSIAFLSLVFSFITPQDPQGVISLIGAVTKSYGQGLSQSAVNLFPALPLLSGAAALIDLSFIILSLFLVVRRPKETEKGRSGKTVLES